jgi:hypothetical protein
MEKTELSPGAVVQINPDLAANPMFGACMVTVTEVKGWGVQGYVQALGEGGKGGGLAYIRLKWEEIEYVGQAQWIRGERENE